MDDDDRDSSCLYVQENKGRHRKKAVDGVEAEDAEMNCLKQWQVDSCQDSRDVPGVEAN